MTQQACSMAVNRPFEVIDDSRHLVTLDPRDPAFFQDPYATYRQLQDQHPTFFWQDLGHWCFTRADDVAALLRDRRLGQETPAPPARPEHLAAFHQYERHSLIDRDPPVHTRLRTLINRAFVSRHIERLRPRIAELAHRLIDGFAAKGEVELIEAFATPIPLYIITEMLGVPLAMAPQLLDWSHRMVRMFQYGRTLEIEVDASKASLKFADFLKGYVASRRGQPGDDLISHLIAAESVGDKLSEDELLSTAILLLNAGHEATVHAIGNSVRRILSERADPTTIFATPDATAATVEECLRFDPPLHLFTRHVQEALEINGIAFHPGDRIGLLFAAANRDPQRIPDPDRFDPGRPIAPHASFGGGIHFCVGAPLARLELQVALPILFQRLPGLRIRTPPKIRDAYHFHGLDGLHLAW